jgi:DNA polymerase III alpha subunit
MGYAISPLDINMSTYSWEVSDEGTSLIQPFSSIKGLGDAAVKQIMDNRPFDNIEDFLFNENIVYSKLNKKALDVLVRSEALKPLMDDRFTGLKHFWSAVAVDRPKNKKRFYKNIEEYSPEGDFTDEEMIEYKVSLTGVFPTHLVMTDSVREQLDKYGIPPLGEYDTEMGIAWFIPREIVKKKTKNNKDYWIVKVIDSTSTTTSVKCWGVKEQDTLHLNRPYMGKLDYDEQWGFSVRNMRKNFKLLA